MRTDSFSKEKHLPVRRFIADESKVATGIYGPRAIADDLDNLYSMFDPEATFLDGSEQGGISEKNLQNGAVSYEKLSEDVKGKFQGIASEQQLSSLGKELDEKLDAKADQSTTLSGYGITDAYTKEETKTNFLSKGDFIEEKAQLATSDMLNQAVCDVNVSVSKKLEETVLHEEVVNTPVWQNQPTYEGNLAFDTSDFYYVTLKNTDGTALPSGQFKLMPMYDKYAEAYDTIFTLNNLKTGNSGTLTENLPVEFTSDYKMRTAGVERVVATLNLPMDSNLGKLTIKTTGQFIKKAKDGYFTSSFTANATTVAHYNSGNATTSNSEGDKFIWHFVNNQGDDYKIGKFVDTFELQMNGEKSFITHRHSLLRYISYGTTTYKNIPTDSVGFGFVQKNTEIKSAETYAVRLGYIRNGSVFTVTEVK